MISRGSRKKWEGELFCYQKSVGENSARENTFIRKKKIKIINTPAHYLRFSNNKRLIVKGRVSRRTYFTGQDRGLGGSGQRDETLCFGQRPGRNEDAQGEVRKGGGGGGGGGWGGEGGGGKAPKQHDLSPGGSRGTCYGPWGKCRKKGKCKHLMNDYTMLKGGGFSHIDVIKTKDSVYAGTGEKDSASGRGKKRGQPCAADGRRYRKKSGLLTYHESVRANRRKEETEDTQGGSSGDTCTTSNVLKKHKRKGNQATKVGGTAPRRSSRNLISR